MKTKHTPGPWTVNGAFVETENSLEICEIIPHYFGQEQAEANAELMAAAPELLEAIQYYFDVLEEVRGESWNEKPDHVMKKMIDAVKKATS